ncbi:MAG: DUF1499 domain-containing protein [Rubripirellula sp.]|nr:DUF1499 domain-containing protein [Rubripirellula sp.]
METSENKRSKRPAIYISVTITAVIMLSVFSKIDNWKRDLTTNQARLSIDAADEQLRPPLVKGTPTEVAKQIVSWVDQQGRWTIVSQQQIENGVEIKLTRTTSIMRFIDDIDVVLRTEGDSTRVQAQSQSRIGKGDLGQNPRNLKELVGHLMQAA